MNTNRSFDFKDQYRKILELGLIGTLVMCQVGFMILRKIEYTPQIIKSEPPKQSGFIVIHPAPPPPPKREPEPLPPEPIPPKEVLLPKPGPVKRLDDLLKKKLEPLPQPSRVIMPRKPFQPHDKQPEPIGGFAAIRKNLKYPERARRIGIEGQVVVNVLVGVTGQVVETKILKRSGLESMDRAVVEAIKSVRWTPALQQHNPVEVWVAIPIKFRLR